MFPIFLTADENYIKYAAVTISSLISQTKSTLQFYILDGGISQNSKNLLAQLLENSSHSIEYIPVSISLFKDFPDLDHFSLNTYSRYLIPQLKPELKKVLYIDSDMIIHGDVEELFNFPMNKGLAAVPYLDEKHNPKIYKKCKENLGLSKQHLYFNAGLLLIDCDYWRKKHITEQLLKKTAELKDKLSMPDQDILNIVFHENYDVLPDRFNFVVDLTPLYFNLKNYINTSSQCFILHYTGLHDERPWVKKNVLGASLFWQYAQLTPFYRDLQFDLLLNETRNLSKIQKRTYWLSLFNFLPLFKLKQNKKGIKIYLFGCVLIFSIKRKE